MRNLLISLELFFIFFIGNSYAQSVGLHGFDFIQSAVGNSSLTEISYLQNPAQINKIDSVTFALGFSPSRFGITELSPAILMFGEKFSEELTISFSITGVGSDLYNELSVAAHGSYRTGKMLVFGGSIEYSRLGIKNYGSENALQFNVGGLLCLSDILSAGFSFHNITRASYYGGDKTTNQKAIFGIGLKAMPDLFFDLDAIITLNRNSGMAISTKYRLENILSFRLAYLTYPRSFEAGARIHLLSFLDLNGILYYHDFLGYTQQFGVSLFW